MELPDSFGVWLKQRRRALDLTQDELARRVGCATITLQKIETDERRPSREIAERLADALQLPPAHRTAFIKSARGELAADQLQLAAPAEPQRPPPTGTLTFLFTTIVGSTQRWDTHPRVMRTALARHDALLRQAITTHGGTIFKTVGEACYAVFATAPAALQAACAAQHALVREPWAGGEPVRVRIALHTGSAELREDDYVGPALTHTARLVAAGHGGQVVLTAATQELVRDQLPPGTTLRDLGSYLLPDAHRAEHLYQLVAPDLPDDFPSLRVPDTRRHNLPPRPTTFIGREREVEAVRDLLRGAAGRLVTLTGPGGIGKTRLSLELAATLLEEYADGVWFVDLAPIGDPALVGSTVATTLGIAEAGGQSLLASLHAYLQEKELLLILDNFEQVLSAAGLVADLLTVAPHLDVLVTSRARLQLRGEQEYPLAPLAVPDPLRLPALPQLSHYAAVALFIERARAVKPDFQVTNATAPAVAEICLRLDGLPLALELAAARIKILPPPALLQRLARRLQILTGGGRDAPARHQTLRATIDWSYRLLLPAEQALFVHLAVFAGGCTLEAAEVVRGSGSDLGSDLLDGVQSLVDNSLLRQREGAEGAPRFSMFETIREYALEQSAASGEIGAVRRRHAQYYLELAETAAASGDESSWLARLEEEQENLRAALGWMLDQDEVAAGLRLGAALRWFWIMRGSPSEGRRWLKMFLVRSDQQHIPAMTRADALFVAGDLAGLQDDVAGAIALLEVALQLYRSSGNPQGEARVLHELGRTVGRHGDSARGAALLDESLACYHALGDRRGIAEVLLTRAVVTALWDGDYDRAVAMTEESVRLFREVGDRRGSADALSTLGWWLHDRGDLERGAALMEEALGLARELGDKTGIIDTLFHGGVIAYRQGDIARARLLLEEALELERTWGSNQDGAAPLLQLAVTARYAGDLEQAQALLDEVVGLTPQSAVPFRIALIQRYQADVAYDQGDVDRAVRLYAESLGVVRELGAKWDCAACIEGLAAVAGAQGETARAVRLWSSAGAIREAIGAPLPPVDRPHRDSAHARLRAALGTATFDGLWAEGREMTLEQAVAYALEET